MTTPSFWLVPDPPEEEPVPPPPPASDEDAAKELEDPELPEDEAEEPTP